MAFSIYSYVAYFRAPLVQKKDGQLAESLLDIVSKASVDQVGGQQSQEPTISPLKNPQHPQRPAHATTTNKPPPLFCPSIPCKRYLSTQALMYSLTDARDIFKGDVLQSIKSPDYRPLKSYSPVLR